MAIDVITEDSSDNIILPCAVEGNADCIVSGAHYLKDLGAFHGIEILDPAAFLEIIET